MIALAWSIGAGCGLVLGFILAAMLLYRDRIRPEPEGEPIYGDVPRGDARS